MWSEGIDMFSSHPTQLLHLTELADVKVDLQTCQLSRHLYIEPVSRAEVSTFTLQSRDVINKAVMKSSAPDRSCPGHQSLPF